MKGAIEPPASLAWRSREELFDPSRGWPRKARTCECFWPRVACMFGLVRLAFVNAAGFVKRAFVRASELSSDVRRRRQAGGASL